MRRIGLLVVSIIFIVGLAALTVDDVVHNGVTPLDVVSVLIIAFLGVAIIGALMTTPPPED